MLTVLYLVLKLAKLKTNTMKKKFFILISAIVLSFSAQAQVEMGQFFASGAADAQALLEPYLAPYLNAFGASLTGGWYNTAKPHSLGGFDITATFNTAFVPDKYNQFDISKITLNGLELDNPADNMTPTIAGEKKTGSQLNYKNNYYSGKAFNMPQGTNWAYVPTPMLQLGVGLIKGTEVIGRYMPTVKLGEASADLWGIGLKHDIKQWIPGLEKLPVLQLSVMGGYTKLSTTIPISVSEDDIYSESNTVLRYENGNPAPNDVWDDQHFDIESKSFTGNVIVSANLPVVCFYGGLGFATTNTSLKTVGYYPMLSGVSGTDMVVTALKDPLDIEVKNQDGTTTKPRLNAGMRFKFGIFTLHGDYTYANYSMFTAGVGLSFR